jgi:hypothetical protein
MDIKIKAKDINENEVSFSLVQGSVTLEADVAKLKIEKDKLTEKINYSISFKNSTSVELSFDNQEDALGSILEKITNTYLKTGLQSALNEGTELLNSGLENAIKFVDPSSIQIKKKKNKELKNKKKDKKK